MQIEKKRAQITIFVIVALILAGVIIVFFIFRSSFISIGIPASIEPVYASFLSCLEGYTLTGIGILESRGGYIELPDFEPGSQHMPFSSQLDFLGNPLPYWYYVSGNNIQREQVPFKSDLEIQLADFIDEKINGCVFDDYYEEGFEILKGTPDAKVVINKNDVEVNLDFDLSIEKGEDKALISSHKVVVKSNLWPLYNSAKKIYEKEQESLFLENYALDTLRLYAPVDGVEISCSPKVWNADDVFDELEKAIESNTLALKSEGGDYVLKNKEDEYFVLDLQTSDENVKFINSKNWPKSFEVEPSEESILISSPVGNQPGMGILGFCYVPYHFVYNIKYPVLIQVYKGEEIFQFPVAVVVQGNKPRESLDVSAIEIGVPELCKNKNTIVEVSTFDTRLNPIKSRISYECFGTKCEIGETGLTAPLEGVFPQCVNGYILATADGFRDAKYLYSTNIEEGGEVDIVLDKLYKIEIDLKLDSKSYNKDAIITFISDRYSKTIVYPEQKTIELSEGQYEVQVYVYRNSSLKIEGATTRQCVEVPQSGLGGFFGLTKEKCFEVEIPSQIVSNALSGGGKQNYYILESELQKSKTIEINAGSLPLPNSLEQLQDNYILFETKKLDIIFK